MGGGQNIKNKHYNSNNKVSMNALLLSLGVH
jgi:hypothetical protein